MIWLPQDTSDWVPQDLGSVWLFHKRLSSRVPNSAEMSMWKATMMDERASAFSLMASRSQPFFNGTANMDTAF
jgi:hypothetical protein